MSQRDKRHTLVLLQTTRDRASRTFLDFDSTGEALTSICSMYEKLLKDLNPDLASMSYEVEDLFAFLEKLPEMSMLVFDPALGAYTPHGRSWIKQAALDQLRGMASH